MMILQFEAVNCEFSNSACRRISSYEGCNLGMSFRFVVWCEAHWFSFDSGAFVPPHCPIASYAMVVGGVIVVGLCVVILTH